jgi:hypothetical protein
LITFQGGKKGVELAGCADLGGLEFFTTQMEAAEGDPELLQVSLPSNFVLPFFHFCIMP